MLEIILSFVPVHYTEVDNEMTEELAKQGFTMDIGDEDTSSRP